MELCGTTETRQTFPIKKMLKSPFAALSLHSKLKTMTPLLQLSFKSVHNRNRGRRSVGLDRNRCRPAGPRRVNRAT